MTRSAGIVPLLSLALALAPFAARAAAPPAQEPEARVALPWPLPPAPPDGRLLGPVNPSWPLERMILVLKADAPARERLERFLADLQEPSSSAYHRWLSPAQFGERFGPAAADVDRLAGWLVDQGLTLNLLPRGRMAITFSGTAEQVQRAFATRIDGYVHNGEVRYAAAVAPSLPASLAGLVEGLLATGNAPRRAMNTGLVPLPRARGLSFLWERFLAPGDFAAIYNTRPLLDRGLDGRGVAIAIAGRTRPPRIDTNLFRHLFGLPYHPPSLVLAGSDPGDLGGEEDGEANLDMQWAGATAPMADIMLVAAASTATTDGVDLAAQHIVDQDLAPVLSVSFGACEPALGPAGVAFYRNLWAQAAAQGISVVVAAGDSGAAGCSAADAMSGSTAAVSGLASTPSNVAVGGTQFAAGTNWSHWSFRNRKDRSSALGYIPETAWNQSGGQVLGGGLLATGGGPSALHAKPAWQRAPGVPADGQRDLPDLSLAAGTANGYLVVSGGFPAAVGGTSCGAPALAGILALLVQHTGGRLGNPCPALYRLANTPSGSPASTPFHPILLGDNSVPGTPGYACGPGYSLATGLGSLDAAALVEAWPRAR